MLEKNKEYKFNNVIEELKKMYFEQGIKAIYKDSNWCVYSNEESINLETICYIDEYPEITDDDEEILPELMRNKECILVYRDEMLQDVVVSALKRKENISNMELVNAIKFYDENDIFLEL